MYIVSLTDIINLNHKLEEMKLSYQVHLRDSCGKQSMWVEVKSECACEGKEEEVKEAIGKFFLEKGTEIKFLSKGLEFVVE